LSTQESKIVTTVFTVSRLLQTIKTTFAARAPPRTPLEELTALLRPPNLARSKGGKRKGEEKGKGQGGGRGRGGKDCGGGKKRGNGKRKVTGRVGRKGEQRGGVAPKLARYICQCI